MTTISPIPSPLPPKDLMEYEQWVLWAYRKSRAGRTTKVPYQINGKMASATDPRTWASHDAVLAEWRREPARFAGIGFVFSEEDPFCGIDLDRCLTEIGEFKPWVQPIIQSFSETYVERSPSGRGVKIWVRGVLSGTGKKVYVNRDGHLVEDESQSDGAIEIYDRGRYFTVTSHVLPGFPAQIEDYQAEVTALYLRVMGRDGRATGQHRRAKLSEMKVVSEGQRHNTLMSVGGQLRAAGLEHDEIAAALMALNERRCKPPKDPAEIEGMVNWLCARPAGEKRTPASIAPRVGERRDDAAPSPLILTTHGDPRALFANAVALLRAAPKWKGVLAFDEFSLKVVTLRSPPWGRPQPGIPWTDQDDRLATEWLQQQGIYVSLEIAGQAVQTVACEHGFHPVRSYLETLKWDGIPRIESWLTVYLGAQRSGYSQAVGKCWLISAVARIYRPGCKADSCLILEGHQGTGKSSALKVLAGDWFTDELPEPGTKEAAVQLQGVWIVELAELDALGRPDAASIKAFMSRSTDRFRPPYAKRAIDAPRQCVFGGTINQDAYLKDETGGRRFWPVRCGAVDLDSLASDRDQLWAEAVACFKRGDSWWLDKPDLIGTASDEQHDRYESDPWQTIISNWIVGCSSTSVSEVLSGCLDKEKAFWNQQDKTRIARCLRVLGWERYRDYQRGNEWRYRPKQL